MFIVRHVPNVPCVLNVPFIFLRDIRDFRDKRDETNNNEHYLKNQIVQQGYSAFCTGRRDAMHCVSILREQLR
jgi:hypothetical protein